MQSFDRVPPHRHPATPRDKQVRRNHSSAQIASCLVPSDGCKPVYLQPPTDLLHFEASSGFSGLVSFILPLMPGRDSIWPYSV